MRVRPPLRPAHRLPRQRRARHRGGRAEGRPLRAAVRQQADMQVMFEDGVQ